MLKISLQPLQPDTPCTSDADEQRSTSIGRDSYEGLFEIRNGGAKK